MYEGQQHWLHYRHIELERNQFLGFFFTLLVAIVGFFVAISARAQDWPALATGLTAMAAVLGLISLLILASVRKFGAVLDVYDRDIARIRQALFERVQDGRTHLATNGAGKAGMQPLILHRVFDPQFAAEVIVGTFGVVAYCVQLVVAAATLLGDDFSTGQRVLACALAAASTLGVVAGGVVWLRYGRSGGEGVAG
ncbi:hypothetical protein ACFO1B_57040 [Dactylosporangium siamense]|uniref:Uncharacterized protein n=1 Tax=Dactylosporangium siamense TaxID=685454 RepID=A0A919PRL5_9ACTN|nr:hypothetical protein [Dactylosporangium siamense]GIG48829.1 hypothetical protein Dsi01nite_068700 [Dactylosporangium siamense]